MMKVLTSFRFRSNVDEKHAKNKKIASALVSPDKRWRADR